MTVSTAAPIAARRTPGLEVAREVAQVLVAFLVYNLGRMLATQDLGRADAHAHGVRRRRALAAPPGRGHPADLGARPRLDRSSWPTATTSRSTSR